MDMQQLMSIMHFVEKLKDTTRHSFTSKGRQESVAEHSWRMAMLAYFVKDEFPEADIHKVILMCLFHDLGEAFEGDIPCFEKKPEEENREIRMIHEWIRELPSPYCGELTQLLQELCDRSTVEAQLAYALDGLEVVLQHNEADISTWNETEHHLLLEYAKERVAFSQYLTELRRVIRGETVGKIETQQ